MIESRQSKNVYFVRAESFRDDVYAIATAVGPDLMGRHHGAYLPDLWRDLDRSSIVNHFKTWLGSNENTNSIFIVDDLDALTTDEAIDQALPQSVPRIIFSTCDPTIGENVSDSCMIIPVGPMEEGDTVRLLQKIVTHHKDEPPFLSDSWTPIARAINGHPLAAWHAVSYIRSRLPSSFSSTPAETFANILNGSDYDLREQFLCYNTRFRPSIQESFEVSKGRLADSVSIYMMILELIALISSPDNPVNVGASLSMRHPWLDQMQPGKLPRQFDIKESASRYLECVSVLEQVSFGARNRSREYFDMHPLWRDCLLHRMGKRNRSVWLRALLFLCHESWVRRESMEEVKPVVRNLLRTCERFAFDPEDLPFAETVTDWIKMMKAYINDSVPRPLVTAIETSSSEDVFGQLRNDCYQISKSIQEEKRPNTTVQDISRSKDGLNALLASLRRVERLVKDKIRDEKSIENQLAVYDELLSIAPLFIAEHPDLTDHLTSRMSKIKDEYLLKGRTK